MPAAFRSGTRPPGEEARKANEEKKKRTKTDVEVIEKKASGGRVGLKSGMRVCKLAKRGKGRAYGKNS